MSALGQKQTSRQVGAWIAIRSGHRIAARRTRTSRTRAGLSAKGKAGSTDSSRFPVKIAAVSR